MTTLFYNRETAVRFVNGLLRNLKPDSPSITITIQAKFGALSVFHVTDLSSEDIELQRAKFFSETQVNT